MKRTVPLLITAIVGFVLIGSSFVPATESWGEKAAIWFNILAGIAFILGGGNLLNSQLKKISDRRAGWGYAVVTLVSFLAMLFVGLFKVGVRPAPNQEYFGQTFAPLPVAALPEFSVETPISDAMRQKFLPASVRRQVRFTSNGIALRGWLSPGQTADLKEFDPRLEWQCAVERLAKEAQPPEALRGKLSYLPDHRVLSFRGFMSDSDEQALRGISAEFGDAATRLAAESRRETTVAIPAPPSGFELPASLADVVTLIDGKATIKGPMSVAQRDQLTSGGYTARRHLPGNSAARDALIDSLRGAGALNEQQVQTLERVLSEDRSAAFIATINTAGAPEAEDKTACELLADRAAGATELNPKKPAAPASTLNAEQERIVHEVIGAGREEWSSLKDRLSAAGTLTTAQSAAVDKFRDDLPTEGERNRELFGELVKLGPVTSAQRELLLKPFVEEYRWRMAVAELFAAAHRPKYRWSGSPMQEGAAFWWLYEYAMQPITSMMFALLAFYVASAAFRAFRAKNLEATLLLGTAFIILLGRTYAGVLLTGWLPDSLSALRLENLSVFLMSAFNTAGNRAIMIGIALGIASTSIKILLGIDRSHIGGRE